MDPRLLQQIAFITELDKLKGVLRRTCPIGQERRENSAEHSWQVMLLAMVLEEHANEPVDLLRVLKMLAIHDSVEIDVGDTFHYEKDARTDLHALESAAADRVFALLPADQAIEFRALWDEFESKQTPESRFAACVDRMVAFLMNTHNLGGTWLEYNLSSPQVLGKNSDIPKGSPAAWEWIQAVVQDAVTKGYLKPV